jgi:hypothetical protein
MWQQIGSDPYDTGLELAVILDGVVHWRVQPCRRILGGWVHCHSHDPIHGVPTHWRPAQVPCALCPSPPPLEPTD